MAVGDALDRAIPGLDVEAAGDADRDAPGMDPGLDAGGDFGPDHVSGPEAEGGLRPGQVAAREAEAV